MVKNEYFESFLSYINKRIYEDAFKLRWRASASCFSRKSRIGFQNAILFSLNFLTKPLFTEIQNYFLRVLKRDDPVTQQSISEARQKIQYGAFQELFEESVTGALALEDSSLYRGFRLLSLDGSTMKLKNVPELKEYYAGSSPTEGDSLARASLVYDVLNKIVVDAKLAPFSKGERQLGLEQLDYIKKYNLGKYIMLMDRGYWKPELYSSIIETGNFFLARVSNVITNEIGKLGLGSHSIRIISDKKEYPVRCYRFLLDTGEKETLVSNLPESEIPDECFSALYIMRWGIETEYNELKSGLKIETFSSKTVQTVLQDFYASVLLSNLISFAGYEAEAEIQKKQNSKKLKYAYQPNRNVIITALKDNMIAAVAAPSVFERLKNLNYIQKTIHKRPTPIRPGRSAKRDKSKSTRRKRSSNPSPL